MLINQRGVLNEGHPPSGLQGQNSEIPATLVRKMDDSSTQQGSDPGKVLPSETQSAPAQLFDGYLKNNCPEASVVPEGYSIPPTKMDPLRDYEEASSTSSSTFGPGYVDPPSNKVDWSCLHPPPVPRRVYYSERIPREQVELLNRSSKSDDAHNSQFHVSDLLSDTNPPESVTESSGNLHDGNLSNLTEETETYFKDNKSVLDETKESKTDFPTLHQVSSVRHHDDPASYLPDVDWGDTSVKESNDASNMQAPPVPLNGNTTTKDDSQHFPSNVVYKQAQGDILIDINDRFPRDLLTDIFSKAILEEDPSGVHPLASDGGGLSINMENHDPKRWSYFHKLAQDGIGNVSLLDQDHLGFSPATGKVVGDNGAQHVRPLTTDEVSLNQAESHFNLGEENQEDVHGRIGTEIPVPGSNYEHPQVNDTDSVQFDAMMENLRARDSEYEV